MPVKNGDKIIDVINEIQTNFQYVVLTQDWHPKDHTSFSSNNLIKKYFPQRKCIMEKGYMAASLYHGTKGAEFHKNLITNNASFIIRKGFRKNIDSTRGFLKMIGYYTGLDGILQSLKIREFLLLDYFRFCVQYTAIDSAKLGYRTYVLKDATLPVDVGDLSKKQLRILKNNIGFGKIENLFSFFNQLINFLIPFNNLQL